MRLIDVTDLKKFIRENVCAIGDDHLLLVAGDDGRWHEALPLVKTTYSVDRVVEELEKELSLADKEKERCAGENYLQFGFVKGYASGISTAIEIVKQGGVIEAEQKLKEMESD